MSDTAAGSVREITLLSFIKKYMPVLTGWAGIAPAKIVSTGRISIAVPVGRVAPKSLISAPTTVSAGMLTRGVSRV
jgi:hypothetical protein